MAIYSASVMAPAAYPAVTAPSFTIPFEAQRITFINEDSTLANGVDFSFDGVSDHGRVTPTVNPTYESRQLVTKVWVKRAAGTPVIRIIAEG